MNEFPNESELLNTGYTFISWLVLFKRHNKVTPLTRQNFELVH